ncbi:MAG: AAA family ATPase [Armatimonadetes bacterium]|nr:AAA family ATPase [Armatimonadota bacterium]
MTKRYLLTGSPSSGKTIMIISLELRGEHIVREAAEDYIRFLKFTSGENIIIDNYKQKQLVDLIIQREKRILPGIDRVFLDRSYPDALAYPHSQEMDDYVHSLHNQNPFDLVFVMEVLPKYSKSLYRLEDKEAVHTIHQKILEVYKGLGYNPIIVPSLPVKNRLEFIMDKVWRYEKDEVKQ